MRSSPRRRLGVDRRDEIDPTRIRRSLKSVGAKLRDALESPEATLGIVVAAGGSLILLPSLAELIILACLVYVGWISAQRYRLPFRLPIVWSGVDPGLLRPGSAEAAPAAGILYLGQEEGTGEGLYLTNDDARRHALILGTTGAGKALPVDALVLTPGGWRRNGDLAVEDQVMGADGRPARVVGVYPQGPQEIARVTFADGRWVECTLEHLWSVTVAQKDASGMDVVGLGSRVLQTADLAILVGTHGSRLTIQIPLFTPRLGEVMPGMTEEAGREAAKRGLAKLLHGPAGQAGDAEQRRRFLRGYLAEKAPRVDGQMVEVQTDREGDGRGIRDLVWSLGGVATLVERMRPKTGKRQRKLWSIYLRLPDMSDLFADAALQGAVDRLAPLTGLEIVAVDRATDERGTQDCVCIKLDRDDGLYVTDGFVVTHNTELLLSMSTQSLMWGSGFIFIDGKGTDEFYTKVYGLARRFGREDDLRVLNFMSSSGDPDAVSGGLASQSNTMNPFAAGSSDQLLNLIVSLMGDQQGGDMWKGRAVQLVSSLLRVLCELRDRGELLLDVQAVRDYLPLGRGLALGKESKEKFLRGEGPLSSREVEALKAKPGMIELYLRALNGEFSDAARLAMKGFFDSLPGFSIEKAVSGQEQESKTQEQYGYLSMQLTKPLGSMADDYGHIFRTPLGEVDMHDVVLQRRILVVLLPNLQKAADEVANLGRIVVASMKMMMGFTMGATLDGTYKEIVEAKATRAPSPCIAVLDECGYYMVSGMDAMAAQARSLGFCLIFGAQDKAAMEKQGKQIADSVAANCNLFAIGKLEDAEGTLVFVRNKLGRTSVSSTTGYSGQAGALGQAYSDRNDVSFQEMDRAVLQDLQAQNEGEFHLLYGGVLVRTRAFYVAAPRPGRIRVNKFLKVRGPLDRAPGLDKSQEEEDARIWRQMLGGLATAPAEHDAPTCDLVTKMAFLARVGEEVAEMPEVSLQRALGAVLGSMDGLEEDLAPAEDGTEEDLADPLAGAAGDEEEESGGRGIELAPVVPPLVEAAAPAAPALAPRPALAVPAVTASGTVTPRVQSAAVRAMFGDVLEESPVGSRALRHVASRAAAAQAELDEQVAHLAAELDAASAEEGARLDAAAELEGERLLQGAAATLQSLDFSAIERLERQLGASPNDAQRRVAALRATMEEARLPQNYPPVAVDEKDEDEVLELVEGLALELQRRRAEDAA